MGNIFKKSLFPWFAAMLLLIIMLIGNTVVLVNKMNILEKQYYQTGQSGYEMLYATEEIENYVAEMQASERAYLLTADPSYLRQFQDTQKELDVHYQSLKSALGKGTPMQGKLQEIYQNINNWVERVALPQISLGQQIYNKQDSHNTPIYVNDKEKDLTSSVSSGIVELEALIQEQESLQKENIAQSHNRVLVQIYLSTGGLALFILIVGLLAYFQKELVQHANDALMVKDKKLQMSLDKLQEASQQKSQFLASMSHELRTPLNSIIGFAQVLQKQFYGPLTDNQGRYVTYILNSGQHLLDMINDILDLSKVEAGKMDLELSRFSLRRLLENSIIMLKEKAIKQHLELTLTISEDVQEIVADERKVKQVIFNLLSNAVKFTPDGGKVHVNANLLVVHEKNYIAVSVADTGIGISPSQHDKIFEPFTQIDGTYTRKNDGTGLGLSVVKRLVELHHGWVRVESGGEGKGSTFYCILPERLSDEEANNREDEK